MQKITEIKKEYGELIKEASAIQEAQKVRNNLINVVKQFTCRLVLIQMLTDDPLPHPIKKRKKTM